MVSRTRFDEDLETYWKKLLNECDSNESSSDDEFVNAILDHRPAEHSTAIVFFDLETGGFSMTDDILQIAMKSRNAVFNRYASPTKYISSKASSVHGLTNYEDNLYLHGKIVKSLPLRSILKRMLNFLKQIGKPCVLVAHNCFSFDSPRLLLKIEEFSLIEEFRKVVVGFTDSLSLFRKKFPDRKRNTFKLTTLAKDFLNKSSEGAHDAMYDVKLLEKLVHKFFSYDDLMQNRKSFNSCVESMRKRENRRPCLQSLKPLEKVVSKLMLERMAYAGITHGSLTSAFLKSDQHLIDLLEQRVEGKAQLIKSKKILNNIIDYLKEYFNVYEDEGADYF